MLYVYENTEIRGSPKTKEVIILSKELQVDMLRIRKWFSNVRYQERVCKADVKR